jgi:hypothetical protein
MNMKNTETENKETPKDRSWLGAWAPRVLMAAVLGASVLGVATVARAEGMAKTPADNQTLAQTYKDKATAFRKEAQDHRTVAKEYRQGDKAFDVTGHANAWALRIASQHEKMAADADRMAVDADKLVDFLEKLGKEMDKK